MKSEHRHELAENDLGKLIDHGRDRIEPYTNKILLGLLVATVLIVGGIVVYRTQKVQATVGAAELVAATTAAEYEAVAEKFPGTETALWARLRAGEAHLREGIRLSLTNRSASNDSLEQAQKSLEQVLKGENVPREIREQALFNLAVCLESLSSQQTTTKPAIDAYKRFISDFETSRYRARAEERVKALESPEAEEFYAWFHAQNPKPEDRPRPMDFNNMPFEFSPDTGRPADMPAGGAAPATGPALGEPATGPALTEPPTDTPAADSPATPTDPATTPAEGTAPGSEPATPTVDPATPTTEPAAPATEPATPGETSATPPATEGTEATTEPARAESTPATEPPANP